MEEDCLELASGEPKLVPVLLPIRECTLCKGGGIYKVHLSLFVHILKDKKVNLDFVYPICTWVRESQ
jgi:hypothetical protein